MRSLMVTLHAATRAPLAARQKNTAHLDVLRP
jgi:hypothetical protein